MHVDYLEKTTEPLEIIKKNIVMKNMIILPSVFITIHKLQ